MALKSILTYFAQRGDYGPGDAAQLAIGKLRSICEGTIKGPYTYFCIRVGSHVAHVRVERTARGGIVFRLTDMRRAMSLLEGTTDGHVLVDNTQRILALSRSAEEIFGWESDEILGAPLDVLVPARHRALHRAHIEKFAAATTRSARQDIVGLRKSGDEFPAESSIAKIELDGGVLFAAVIRDLSELKQAEEARRRNEVAMAQAQHLAKLARFRWSITERRLLGWDESYDEILGITPGPGYAEGKIIDPHFHPDDRERVLREYGEREAGRRNVDLEYRIVRSDGEVRWIHELAEMQFDAEGRPSTYLGTLQDVTAQKQLEAAAKDSERTLRDSEKRFRDLVEGSIQGIFIHDENGKPLFANQAFASIYGFDTPEELLKFDTLDHLIPAEDRDRILGYRQARLRGEPAPLSYEARRLKRDGTVIWLDNRSRVIEWRGRPAIQAIVVDVTERKLAENALRESVAALAQASKIAKLGHYTWSANEKRLLTRTQAYLDILGLTEDPEPGTVGGLASVLHPEDRSRAISESLAAEAEGRGLQLEYRIVRPDGTIAHIRELSEPIPGHRVGVQDWFGTIQDISDIRKAEEELRRSEQRFRTLTDNLPGVVYRRIVTPDGQVRDIYVSPRVKELLGVDAEEFTSGRATLIDFLHPDDREKKLAELHEAAESLQVFQTEERNIVRPTGEVRWWQSQSMPTRLPDGSVQFDGIALDVTERRAMEEQLKQVLKMEAIGHLTGGIAHDFNNLLTVILGNTDELSERVAGGSSRHLLDNIVAATHKASQLTARLLAFARKQPLEPRAININRFVFELRPLLQRTLGEDIDIEMRLKPDLWNAYVDAHQVEAAVLNLAINARDAMVKGGHLTIETSNVFIDEERAVQYGDVKPGAYVALDVTDDGCGMPPDVLNRAIEPFFTTKGSGKGTGLGLSMVHGFAKQSGGHMTIYSEVGNGTTVHLYFPRSTAAAERDEEATSGQREIPGGQETILVVEDNPAVRETATLMLRSLGYAVLVAGDGAEAVAIARGNPRIDLLFTDVIMPGGMTGPNVAKALRSLLPGIRVLYTSGYTEDAIVHQGKLDEGVELLQKPYRRPALAQKIRAVLDRK